MFRIGDHRSRWVSALKAGAEAGLCATAAMSLAMAGLQGLGLLGRMPPRTIVRRGLARVGIRTRNAPGMEKALSITAHFAFGATQGAVYALLEELRREARDPEPGKGSFKTGVPFGLAVWISNYGAALPALRIFQPPFLDRPGRPPAMALAHAVYGATLAAVLRQKTS